MEGEIEETKASGPSEILSWLYLGSKYHYFDSDNLKSLGLLSNRPDNLANSSTASPSFFHLVFVCPVVPSVV
jgi:hypothetical protein